jgi:hypothetical protein
VLEPDLSGEVYDVRENGALPNIIERNIKLGGTALRSVIEFNIDKEQVGEIEKLLQSMFILAENNTYKYEISLDYRHDLYVKTGDKIGDVNIREPAFRLSIRIFSEESPDSELCIPLSNPTIKTKIIGEFKPEDTNDEEDSTINVAEGRLFELLKDQTGVKNT